LAWLSPPSVKAVEGAPETRAKSYRNLSMVANLDERWVTAVAVGMRLDGPGMRWGKGRAEAVLHLRCVVLNGLWTDFEAYLARRASLRLAAQPAPTVPHDAKPQMRKAA
jgi:hypothetical protein